MMVAEFVFYLFAALTVLSALGVVGSRNPVHSVLSLVLAFFSTAGLFVLMGAEFLAAILVMVYMGAVAILFLFVVMMLDVDFAQLRRERVRYLPLGLAVGVVMLVELGLMLGHHHLVEPPVAAVAVDNTLAIGQALFTRYIYPFEVASLILLVALVGAVALTHRERKRLHRQEISQQLARTREDAVELRKVASGEGA
ncbi:MAG: NADH-quinone oxidoreductase subunit J [Magnetococcales bacterium]|nr:NADH-quinone oxidoreductase subunit J [Magnetococcales bacterium]MBF0149243.1 NADH-quinone oxidoreductase subunit J [Magnetococcales bacterium]MBF0174302.1 NADH-quinone oxidoreductase subunit J [Magnetococcales bacterium]MBF0348400.1 NADH-quinone oxidoreductase subunit J [Magnetococcales bacterium]MBF0632415.1 NADH-quinone oxidoreductase subunit J [Magnetococcales bacterium]